MITSDEQKLIEEEFHKIEYDFPKYTLVKSIMRDTKSSETVIVLFPKERLISQEIEELTGRPKIIGLLRFKIYSHFDFLEKINYLKKLLL